MVQCCTRKVFIPVLLSRILLQFAAVPSPLLLACASSSLLVLFLTLSLSSSCSFSPTPQYSPIHPPPGFSFHPFFSDTPKYPFFCRTIDWLLASSYWTVLVVLLKTQYSSVSQRSTGVQQPTVHSPQSTAHSPKSSSTPTHSPVHSPVNTSNQPISKRSPYPISFSPTSHITHRVAYYTPHTPYNSPHHTLLARLTTRHNSICFPLSSASASASVFASAAHYRLLPIYLGLYPLALLCTHCTYIHTGPENRKSPILKYGFKFSYTDSSVVCVVCAAIPRLSLPRLANCQPQTHRQPPRRRPQPATSPADSIRIRIRA